MKGANPIASSLSNPLYHVDFTAANLPIGITISRAANKGFGLFVTKAFACGDWVYSFPLTLCERDAVFVTTTDVGILYLFANTHSYGPLTQAMLQGAPKELLQGLSARLGFQTAGQISAMPELLEDLWKVLTDDGRKVFIFSGFDALVNHSAKPTGRYDGRISIDSDRTSLRAWGSLWATRDMTLGDEITVDYRSFIPNFVPPAYWSD